MAADDEWGPPFEVEPKEMTLDSDGVTLSMTVWEREAKPVVVPEGKKAPKIKEGAPEAPPRAWCLLVHGLLSERREFGRLGALLASRGYGVIAVDLRGHGKSGGARGVYDLERAVADLRNVIAHFGARHEQWDLNPQQWGVIGHSTGAIVALNLAHYLHAGDVVVAASPFRSPLHEVHAVKRLGYAFAYRLASGRNGDEPGPTLKYEVSYRDTFADRDARERAEQMGFLQTRIPLRNYPLFKAMDGVKIARDVRDPTVLVMVAEQDKVIRPSSSKEVYDAVSSAKELVVVKGSGHSMFLDGKGEEAMDLLIDWLGYRLSDFNEVRVGHTKR